MMAENKAVDGLAADIKMLVRHAGDLETGRDLSQKERSDLSSCILRSAEVVALARDTVILQNKLKEICDGVRWLKASTQADLERGIAAHLEAPAATRGLDLTLLGPIDLEKVRGALPEGSEMCHYGDNHRNKKCCCFFGVDCVRVGCEAGPKRWLSAGGLHGGKDDVSFRVARWMGWLRLIVCQCEAAGVPVEVTRIPVADGSKIGWRASTDPAEWPEWARKQEAKG